MIAAWVIACSVYEESDRNGPALGGGSAGCTVAGQIRATPDGEVLANFTGTIQDQTDPDTKGRILWELFNEDTQPLPLTDPKNKWGYDLQITDPSGEPETAQYGSVTVKGDYTHE